MNSFTDREKDNLYDRILQRYGEEYVGGIDDIAKGYTKIVIQGKPCEIRTHMLLKIIHYEHRLAPDLQRYLDSDFELLHKLINIEPLNRVPLYLNDIPEVAAWRLEIGK
jgi:hypothetical protein